MLGYLLSNRPWNKVSVFDIIAIGTTKHRLSKGGELPMWEIIFLNIIAPTAVGIVLALFSKWLDKKDDD